MQGVNIEISWRRDRSRRYVVGRVFTDYYILRRGIFIGKIVIWITRDYDLTFEEWEKRNE